MTNRYRFTPLDIDRCLTVLAFCGGNANDAIRRLQMGKEEAEDGDDWQIPNEATLRRWSKVHVDRYVEIHKGQAERIEGIAIAQARDTVLFAGTLEGMLLEKIAEKMDDIPAKDLAGALRNVATTRGISVDKLMLLTDRPTAITDKRDAAAIIAAIARKAPGLVLDDVDVVPAELTTGAQSAESA